MIKVVETILHQHLRLQLFRLFIVVECGWVALIDSTLRELAADCPESRIVQVKEKFGGLRIYLEDKTDETAKAILRRAEESSLRVCEVCGAPGQRMATHGWVRVRCDTHSEY